MILQVALQQGSGPDGRMIAEVSRIRPDHPGDQGIHAAVLGSGTTLTWGVSETFPQVESGALLEPTGPVVDRLTAHLQGFGDRLDLLALVEPEQRLGATSLLGRGGMGGERFEFAAPPGAEFERSHRHLLPGGRCAMTHCICQWTYG